MSTGPVPAAFARMLAKPNLAVIGTLRRDGSPRTVPTWYLWLDGRILVNMDDDRARLRDLRRDARVSLTVFDGNDWYTHISLRGRVTALHDDADLLDANRIWSRYGVQQPPGGRSVGRVSVWIDVESWHTWGDPEAAPGD